LIRSDPVAILIPSPAERLELTLSIPAVIPDGIEVSVYSIDGRLRSNIETEELNEGTATFSLEAGTDTGRLPAGMFIVRITGLDSGEIVRKVIILDH